MSFMNAISGGTGSSSFTGGLFGQSNQTQKPMFGNSTLGSSNQSNLFGGSTNQTSQQSGGLFGNGSQSTNNSTGGMGLFGQAASGQKPSGTGFGLFGGQGGQGGQQQGLFGGQGMQSSGTGMMGLMGNSSSDIGTIGFTYSQSNLGKNTEGIYIHCITGVRTYNKKSLEELRAEDYTAIKNKQIPDQKLMELQTKWQKNQAGGQTQSNNLFGMGGTQNSLGQTGMGAGGLFGSSTQNQTGGGLFGQSSNSTQGSGLFGGNSGMGNQSNGNNQQNTGALFGGAGTQGGGLFGQKTGGAGGSGGLFGNNSGSSSSGGLFGNNSTASNSGGLFGNKSTSSGSGGMFGNNSTSAGSGGGMFGNNSTSAGSGGGLFGNNSTMGGGTTGNSGNGGLFGNAGGSNLGGGMGGNSTGGLFSGANGQKQTSTGTTGGGLFGNGQSSSSSGGLFGSKPQQQTGTSGGGLFGNSQSSGGLFGGQNTQQQQQQQPAKTDSLFGNGQAAGGLNQQAGSTGSGLFGNGQQQNKTNLTGTSQNQTGGQGSGLFGNASAGQTQGSGMFSSLAGGVGAQQGSQGTSQLQNGMQALAQLSGIEHLNSGHIPNTAVELYDLLGKTKENESDSYRLQHPDSDSVYPRMMKIRSQFNPFEKNSAVIERNPRKQPNHITQTISKREKKALINSKNPNLNTREEELDSFFDQNAPELKKKLKVNAYGEKTAEQESVANFTRVYDFVSVQVVFQKENSKDKIFSFDVGLSSTCAEIKSFILKQILNSEGLNFFQYKLLYKNKILKGQALVKDLGLRDREKLFLIPDLDSTGYSQESTDLSETSRKSKKSLAPENLIPVLTKNYQTSPSLLKLSRMTEEELSTVENFSIFNENARITFQGKTDLRSLNLDEIVILGNRSVEVYPEEGKNSIPEAGKELNKAATIEFYGWSLPKKYQNDVAGYVERLKKQSKSQNVCYKGYDHVHGVLVVSVANFSFKGHV